MARPMVAVEPPGVWTSGAGDPSGCWVDEGFTFEHCCAAWNENDVGVGNPTCWTGGFSYQRCCEPREAPRDLFTCHDRGRLWQRFRRDMMLGRSFGVSDLRVVGDRGLEECLLGGLIATLAYVTVVAHEVRGLRAPDDELDASFERANKVLRLVLRSPISFDELLASGWPVGPVLASLQLFHPVKLRVSEHSRHNRGPSERAMRLVSEVASAITDGRRVPLSLALELAADPSEEPEFSGCTAAWAAAHALRAVDLPRAPLEEQGALEAEAVKLVKLGGEQLRSALLRAWPGGPRLAGPLTELLAVQLPILEFLQALQWRTVIPVDLLSIFRDTVFFPGLVQRVAGGAADSLPAVLPMSMHVLPRYDSVSNMVRTSRQVFCYDRAFLAVVANAAGRWAQRSSQPREHGWRSSLRLWEVGANLGDCTLWASAVLAGGLGTLPATGLHVDARGFEPLPSASAAFARSARDLLAARRRIGERGGLQLEVQQVALGDVAGTLALGIPNSAEAEATFQDCTGRYGYNGTGVGCRSVPVEAQTLDGVLRRGRPLDLLKVHVQGHELRMLRGAARSLSSGRVCVVLLKISSLAHGEGTAAEVAAELLEALGNFSRGALLNFHADPSGFASPLWVPSGTRPLAHLVSGFRHHAGYALDSEGRGLPNAWDRAVVAWHRGGDCQDSLTADAAEELWGYGA